jgi:very-short-patch-repair endonuclease
MRLLAQSRGGVCLSDTYEGMHTPLLWHCGTSMHPPWRASPANVIYRTSWCPACSGKDANTEADYHALAADLDLAWTGDVLPPSVHHNAHWQCLRCDAPFEAKMNNLRYNPGRGCPNCADFVNGARVSIPQRQLAELLEHRLGAEADVELNRQLDTRSSVVWIDVAVLFDDGRVLAVEYDAWYYHGDRLESDRARDEDVIAAGWPVLRIWSGVMMPTWEQLVPALERLLSGASTREVVILGDWGRGPTMSEAHAPGDPDDSPPCACAEAPAEEAPAEEAPEDEAPGNDTLGGGLPARSRCAA